MQKPLLEQVNSPEDLKQLPMEQLPALCGEIRSFLLDSVSKTGGHLSSNLGTVELTVALHYALNLPQDKILFDVGHQCYTHKILTGRREEFPTLRKMGGLSGFPSPRESEYDTYISGHGNTAISVAIGVAQAKKLKGEQGCAVAVVGDGAFTGGMVYEGLNNIGKLNNLIVILNDNKMSISKNVGAMARYLTRLRTAPGYVSAKAGTEQLLRVIPLIGNSLVSGLQKAKMFLRRQIYRRSTFFEEMGFQYIGIEDGHDVEALTQLIKNIRASQYAPVLIHVVTTKGKGYAPAEENPGEFHGVSAFDTEHLMDPELSPSESFSTQFGKTLVELGESYPRICAITAAMKYGTGLQYFYRRFPQRFFDVGMAEQHAVTFAGGLASQGMRPVVAIYSTFLQRSYDQLIHDISLMHSDVLLAIDRAGLVPGDGETHQGIYDPAFLSSVGIQTYSPSNYEELRHWLKILVREQDGPRAIRYSRGGQTEELAALGCSGEPYDLIGPESGEAKVALVTYGTLTAQALKAKHILEQEGISVHLIKLVQICPIPQDLPALLQSYAGVVFAEECVYEGGIGQYLESTLYESGWRGRYLRLAVLDRHQPPGTVEELQKYNGLDPESMVNAVKEVSL